MKKTFLVLVILLLNSCGYTPIYSSKGSDFKVLSFQKNIDNTLTNYIENTVTEFSSEESNKNLNIKETDDTNPINPYSASKLKFEKYLINETKKNKASCTILRYFNVAGADLKKRTGLISNPDNLIKVICEVASNKKKKLIINFIQVS